MDKSENRIKQEKQIIDKIQSIFDNAEHIIQFQFEINGGSGMSTTITHTVVERIAECDE